MPVRKVYRHGRNIIGKIPSVKMERMIAFESLIERDFIYLLDYEQEVQWFEEQPLSIEYQHEGKILHYTPDFHLLENGRNVLVECKPEKFISTSENRLKAAIARRWCQDRSWEFRIVTDQQIRAGFRLQNIKLLTRYSRQKVSPEIVRRIHLLMEKCKEVTIGKIVQAASLYSETIVISTILYMVFHHKLCISLVNKLSMDTPIFLMKEQKEERCEQI